VEGQLLELRPDRLREAARVIADLPGVLEVQTYGDLLHVFVDDAARRAPEMQAALAGFGIAAEGLRQTRPRMEEAFISLIRKRSEEDT
jgi:ABC-2 type transport system ATP-binding protein